MIARYDAERRAVGLSRIRPFADYQADTGEGYDSEAWLWNGREWFAFRARPAGATIGDLPPPPLQPGWTIDEQETFRDRISEASATGRFAVDGLQTPVEADNLGNTAEASLRSVDDEPRNTYGDLHNMGHVHFAYYDNQPPPGVMISTATAVRDPIFWRWHKHVDSFFRDWQETQAPYDFSDSPPVRIRNAEAEGTIASTDIILCLKDGLPAEFDGEKLGSDAFGYSDDPEHNSWDKDFASATVTLPTGEIIEMDKFLYRLDGSERAIISRRADLSSVIRKPALKPEDFTPGTEEPSPKTGQQSWCDCGWPYTLLLPRGTREGMRFRLFVMFSEGDDLALPEEHAEHCTSVSYCGLQDEEYPDKRDMGYPFSRPFRDGISPTVAAHDNMAWRTITIRCHNL
jgi:hypothetical protein